LDRVAGDYKRQSRLARELAVESFSSDRVLSDLLQRAMEIGPDSLP
jgi:hypothetical protein